MVLSTVSLRAERLLCIGGLGVRDSSWMYAYKTHAYGRFGHLWGKISESLEPVPRVQCLIFRMKPSQDLFFINTNDLTRAES